MNINFGEETWRILQTNGYTREDISWIGCKDFQLEEGWFWTIADNTVYYPSYGRPEIPQDLVIVMKDNSWFEREEYDGSEWWRHIQMPIKPEQYRHIREGNFKANFPLEDWAPSLKEFCDEVS